MRKQLLAAVGAGTAALLLVAPMPASAAAKPKVKVVSSAVFAPFNLDVSTGKILVADGGANAIVRGQEVRRHGQDRRRGRRA